MTYDDFLNFLDQYEELKSFRKKIDFAAQNLQRIGSGSGRIVYDIDGTKVFKVAKNAKGVAQNGAESDAGRYEDTNHITTKVFEYANDDSWIIAEKGKKVNEKRIIELTGIPSLNDLFYYVKNFVSSNNGRGNAFSLDKNITEQLNENEFAQDLTEFIANYSQQPGDYGRASSYGEVLRDGQPTIVLTDYGLNDEVYDTFYSPKKKEQYRMYELYNFADGNDDMLGDMPPQDAVDTRRGMWAQMPYGVGDGDGVINEEFIHFISNRDTYPSRPTPAMPIMVEGFHECVNNLKEVLNHVPDKKKFYRNLLKLQEYLISQGAYDREPLELDEASSPRVGKMSLTEIYATEVATAFAAKMGLPTPTILGGGSNGYAFKINDRVLKLSTDTCEVDSGGVIHRVKPKTIAYVFDMYKIIDTAQNTAIYALIEEFIADKPTQEFWKHINFMDSLAVNDNEDFTSMMIMLKKKKFTIDQIQEHAQFILNNKPEINNPTERKAAYDFMVGIFNICRELDQMGITSKDYSNPENLGYKDGVLTYFDVGHCKATEPPFEPDKIVSLPESVEGVDENYDRNTADNIANQMAKNHGYQKLEYIDAGTFGVAYDIGNDRVLKITGDKSEAMENLELKGKPLKYIAIPYEIYAITPKEGSTIPNETYAIILEKLKTDRERFKRLKDRMDFAFEKIMDVSFADVVDHYVHDVNYDDVDEEKIKKYMSRNPEDAWYFHGVMQIAEEAKQYGIESMDYLNYTNLGYKPNGDLAFFDVGFGNYFFNSNNPPKEFQLGEDGSAKFSTADAIGQDNFPIHNNDDTSPSIQNDLNANSAMYNEDLEYNHASDATQDEYVIDERVLSSMKGSSSVEVKQKCRLGGNGNTSTACNQGDISNLNIKSLKEEVSREKYYRAVEKNMGETVEFEPEGYYEAIDDNGDPIWKYDTFWVSDKPEVAASKSVGGAVMGLYSMFIQHNKNPEIFYVYVITEKPDVDISHWEIGDFAHLKEVRYRRPVQGKYLGKVTITDDFKKRMNAFYEINSLEAYDEPDEEISQTFQDTDYEQYLNKMQHSVHEDIDASEAYDDMGAINTLVTGKRNVGYVNMNSEEVEDVKSKGINVLPVFPEGSDIRKQYYDHMSTTGGWGEHGAKYFADNAYIIYHNEGKEDAIKLYWYIKSHGGFVSDNSPEEATTLGKLLGYNDASIAQYVNKRYNKVPAEKSPEEYADFAEGVDNSSNERKFTDDPILNGFLNKLAEKTPLQRNPFMPREFIYGDKGSLEFSRFDKQDRNEVELQDIMAFEKSKGIGSSMMKDIVDTADELGVKLTLTAKPFGTDPKGLKIMDLINFYRKFGFKSDLSTFDGEFKSDSEYDDYVSEYPDEGMEMTREPNVNEVMNEAELMSLQDLPFKQEVEQLGGKIFSVGGAVRDEFLGKESKDLDVLITGVPFDQLEQILGKYGRVDAVGKSFGVLKFKPKGGEEIDIAIPRTEKPTGDAGHKAFDVTSDHALPIEKDLERRDFTINAIAKDTDGNIVDPYHGQEDLKNKIIRVVNPEAFSDDPLRMLRAVQFASRFGFTIEPQTMQMIVSNASRVKEIAPERILTEFDKIIQKGNKRIGVSLLVHTGLYQQIFGGQLKQSMIDRKDFEGVKTMGEFIFLLSNGIVQQPAAFFKTNLKGDIDAFKEIKALELAFDSDETTNPIVARTIAHNMYLYSPQALQSQILPSVIKTAAEELLQGKYPKTVNELAVNGTDLVALGLKGKAIGDMQKSLLMKIYADKIRNNREELLALAGKTGEVNEFSYPELQIPKDSWNVGGQEVGLHFFVEKYDEWNQNGRFRDPSKESVLRFLEDLFPDLINDEKLRKELLWELTDRDILNESVDEARAKAEPEAIEPFEFDPSMVSDSKWQVITNALTRLGYTGRPYRDWKEYFNKIGKTMIPTASIDNDKTRIIKKVFTPRAPMSDDTKLIAKAKRHFGTTTNFNEVGYVLPDGSMLNFSGAKFGGSPNRRDIDHRQVGEIDSDILSFMKMGNIRMQSFGFELVKMPTRQQFNTLVQFIRHKNDYIIVDFATPDANYVEHSVEYPKGTNVNRIINDIINYFNNGVKPVAPPIREDVNNSVSYSAVVLDEASKQKLIKVFKPMIPEGWEILAHHMTLNMGAIDPKYAQDLGKEFELTVIDYGIDKLVMAVGVKGYPTNNKKAHITLAVNRQDGGKPMMSNNLTDWRPIQFSITLTGKVTEVRR